MRREGLVLGAIAFLAATAPAVAQDINSCSLFPCERRVATGRTMDFQWLNYDEAGCRDHGHARLVVTQNPTLGRFSSRRSTVTPQSGPCAGRRLSLLLVTYRAGRKPGTDSTAYRIVGQRDINVKLNMVVY